MEFVENREVEKEQLKAIFRDMVKYSPSKIIGMLGNAIIVYQLLFYHSYVSSFLIGWDYPV